MNNNNPELENWLLLGKVLKGVFLTALNILALYFIWSSSLSWVFKIPLSLLSHFVCGLIYNILIAFPLMAFITKKFDLK